MGWTDERRGAHDLDPWAPRSLPVTSLSSDGALNHQDRGWISPSFDHEGDTCDPFVNDIIIVMSVVCAICVIADNNIFFVIAMIAIVIGMVPKVGERHG